MAPLRPLPCVGGRPAGRGWWRKLPRWSLKLTTRFRLTQSALALKKPAAFSDALEEDVPGLLPLLLKMSSPALLQLLVGMVPVASSVPPQRPGAGVAEACSARARPSLSGALPPNSTEFVMVDVANPSEIGSPVVEVGLHVLALMMMTAEAEMLPLVVLLHVLVLKTMNAVLQTTAALRLSAKRGGRTMTRNLPEMAILELDPCLPAEHLRPEPGLATSAAPHLPETVAGHPVGEDVEDEMSVVVATVNIDLDVLGMRKRILIAGMRLGGASFSRSTIISRS